MARLLSGSLVVLAAWWLPACGPAAGQCTLAVEGTDDDGVFDWCDVLLLGPDEDGGPSVVRLLAQDLPGCDDACFFMAELEEGSRPDCSEKDEAGLNPRSLVTLSLPGFPADENGSREGGAAFFDEGSSCDIETGHLDTDPLGFGQNPAWEGRIEATLLLNDGGHADVVIEGSIPAMNVDFADSKDPELRGR